VLAPGGSSLTGHIQSSHSSVNPLTIQKIREENAGHEHAVDLNNWAFFFASVAAHRTTTIKIATSYVSPSLCPLFEFKIITVRSIQHHPAVFGLATHLCRRPSPFLSILAPIQSRNISPKKSLGDHCRSGVTCLISIRSMQKQI